jgi:hypothetical protein
VGELTVNGHLDAAKRLLSFLIGESTGPADARALMAESSDLGGRPVVPKNGSWLNTWEEAHEP